ncbi:VOC family protein [Comamonas sp. JC664]|uniref:VOC family protein n=1 Tax=Comamonas sp. JC664 TaxID=2801917 RepID=UPI00191F45A6|nr:VOC family protein [Comamonas sp. JC664]MBL0696307.1 VOC family protein [Comamonas sp. JC664]GHG66388.1 hypothetical protein GCM10012319_08440 [Comamonas sp. KCTC 72670]
MNSFIKLLVQDASRSAVFYETLGFERVSVEPPFIHLRWADAIDVYLVTPPPGLTLEGQRGLGTLLGFRTPAPTGVDDVLLRAQSLGAHVDGPSVQPWHTREVIVTDPDGYRLNFIEPA